MSMRLKIGSYIIDAAESSSTSTTTGCRLLMDAPGAGWSENRTTAQIRAFVQISRDSVANYKTSRDALVNALTKTVNADIVLESAAGTTFKDWLVSTNAWQKVEGDVTAENESENGGDTAGLLLIIITISRIAPASGSAGDATGNLDGIEWDFAIDGNGKGGALGRALFNTKDNAAAWVQAMRAGTAWPDWLDSTNGRFAGGNYGIAQQPNQASPVPDAAYTPVIAQVLVNILPSAWGGDSAFASVVDADCEMSVTPRPRTQEEANARPGLNVLFTGRLQFKTEIEDSFDSNDSSATATSGLTAAALACIAVMKSDMEARRNITFEYPEGEGGIELRPTGRSGEVLFTAIGLAEFDGVFDFSDDVHVERRSRDKVLEGSRGSVVMQSKIGPLIVCTQTGAARSNFLLTPVPPAFIDDTWFEEKWRPSKPKVRPPHDPGGMTIYEVTWEGQWFKLRNGNVPATTGRSFEEVAQN